MIGCIGTLVLALGIYVVVNVVLNIAAFGFLIGVLLLLAACPIILLLAAIRGIRMWRRYGPPRHRLYYLRSFLKESAQPLVIGALVLPLGVYLARILLTPVGQLLALVAVAVAFFVAVGARFMPGYEIARFNDLSDRSQMRYERGEIGAIEHIGARMRHS